jgi:hypothetical protein
MARSTRATKRASILEQVLNGTRREKGFDRASLRPAAAESKTPIDFARRRCLYE